MPVMAVNSFSTSWLSTNESCRDTAHAVPLTELTANAKYVFRIRVKDAAGKIATSRDTTFTTLGQRFTFMTLPTFDRLVTLSGDGQISKPEKLLMLPLTVKALNTAGAPLANISVAFRIICRGRKNFRRRQLRSHGMRCHHRRGWHRQRALASWQNRFAAGRSAPRQPPGFNRAV